MSQEEGFVCAFDNVVVIDAGSSSCCRSILEYARWLRNEFSCFT